MKNGMGRQKKKEPTESIRLYRSSVKALRKLAIDEDTDPADFFDKLFAEALRKRLAKMGEKDAREAKD